MKTTVVFDMNILFSATGWRGRPFECVGKALAGEIAVVTCPELMEELAEKLEGKLGFSSEQAAETLADYLSHARLVSIPHKLKAVSRDPKDNMVLECAVEGQADFIVSGDQDLLVLKDYRGIRIVTAVEFLELLAKRSK